MIYELTILPDIYPGCNEWIVPPIAGTGQNPAKGFGTNETYGLVSGVDFLIYRYKCTGIQRLVHWDSGGIASIELIEATCLYHCNR